MKKDDKARVRVFFGEIEGDNESLRDGLRSIAQAVNRTFQSDTRIVKVLTVGGVSDQKLTDELELGDRSAHNRRYSAVKADLDKVQSGVRVAVDEMIALSDLRRHSH